MHERVKFVSYRQMSREKLVRIYLLPLNVFQIVNPKNIANSINEFVVMTSLSTQLSYLTWSSNDSTMIEPLTTPIHQQYIYCSTHTMYYHSQREKKN